jgi:hypothetical protein
MSEVRKVKDAYVITQIDDGSSIREHAEEQLKQHGCTTIIHTKQSDIRNDQMWLQSVGYVLESV